MYSPTNVKSVFNKMMFFYCLVQILSFITFYSPTRKLRKKKRPEKGVVNHRFFPPADYSRPTSALRNPSPVKLNARTAQNSASPGKKVKCQ